VVGIDVAGDEARPIQPLVPFLKRARKAGLALTLHAGEARGPESVREALALGASRLGHGVRAVRDPKLMEEILRRRIAFELCPTSNVQTGAVRSLAAHPLNRLLRDGHRVTLNTDDPAISGIDLTHEFGVARRLGLSPGGGIPHGPRARGIAQADLEIAVTYRRKSAIADASRSLCSRRPIVARKHPSRPWPLNIARTRIRLPSRCWTRAAHRGPTRTSMKFASVG